MCNYKTYEFSYFFIYIVHNILRGKSNNSEKYKQNMRITKMFKIFIAFIFYNSFLDEMSKRDRIQINVHTEREYEEIVTMKQELFYTQSSN